MAIADDFTVAANGDIRYSGTSTYYTVIEFHRFLQDLADDAEASGNDLLDITDETPSDRSTDNIITLNVPYNIDDTSAEHLYDGSLTQDGGDTVYSGLVVVGAVESGTQLQIVQDNALLTNYWTTGLNTDAAANILLRIVVKTRNQGANIDGGRLRVLARELGDTYSEFSVTMGLGNNTAAIFTGADLNNATGAGTISGWTISNTEGYQQLDIGVAVGTEPYYSRWETLAQSINDVYEYTKWIQRRGTSETIHSMNGELFRGITHDITFDAESAALTEDEVLVWGTSFAYDTETGADGWVIGEYLTFSNSGAVAQLLDFTDAGTTGTMIVAVESGTGTIVDPDTITQLNGNDMVAEVNGAVTGAADTGGTGALLAYDDDGTTGRFFIQLLTGAAPTDGMTVTGLTSSNTVDVDTTITVRTISPAFVGVSTGSNIIGAYGIGFDPDDVGSSDQFFDLDNSLQVPPNNVTFTVGGIESGDRVLVGPEDGGGGLDTDQFTGATGSNAAGAGTWVVNEAIPSDTPSSGDVRVFNGSTYEEVPYSSWATSTFTLTGTLTSAGASHVYDWDNEGGTPPWQVGETLTYGGGGTAELLAFTDDGSTGTHTVRMLTGSDPIDNDTISGGTSSTTGDVTTTTNPVDEVGGFIAYIDITTATTEESFTSIYLSDRDLFIRVREGTTATPIKTFETTGTLGSGGGSTTAIRTDDF